ncbi:hypothetical protein [Trinickia mobilis]|uniref:hypothetical protein n=1 Tax=Trinickia mobilis TaxID=2816356 RepID=UPI001A8DDDB2|nr:hypothetical protein [Trinickia mobilis]
MSTRYFILGECRRMVEVFDPEAWSQWMADNDTVLRLTEFESLGTSVLTRFEGTASSDGSKSPYSTSIIEGREQSVTIPSATYIEALRQHDRMVDRLLAAASTRSRS